MQLLSVALSTSRAMPSCSSRLRTFSKNAGWKAFFLGVRAAGWLELASAGDVATPESDLDIVLYAERRMTAEEAKSLCDRAMSLPAVVDIRVETPVCGFSLKEFAGRAPQRSSCAYRDGLCSRKIPGAMRSEAWIRITPPPDQFSSQRLRASSEKRVSPYRCANDRRKGAAK